MLHFSHIAKNERKQFVRTLTLALFFKAGSAGFVVSLTMQCSQELTPFAGKTLHEILVVYHLSQNSETSVRIKMERQFSLDEPEPLRNKRNDL